MTDAKTKLYRITLRMWMAPIQKWFQPGESQVKKVQETVDLMKKQGVRVMSSGGLQLVIEATEDQYRNLDYGPYFVSIYEIN